jgi:transcriptional regulator with XRE-family HTH domain
MREKPKLPTIIRCYRLANDLTLRNLEKLSGVKYSSLSNYEHRRQVPSTYHISMLKSALNCSADDIINDYQNELDNYRKSLKRRSKKKRK